MGNTEHLHKRVKTVRGGRIFLSEQLAEIGLSFVPQPQVNFVFARPSPLGLATESLLMELMRKSIAARGPPADWTLNYLRISIGTTRQNEMLIDAIGRVVNR